MFSLYSFGSGNLENWRYNPIVMSRKSEREKQRRIRNRRKRYEFTQGTKNEAVRRSGGMCESCGERPGSEWHHKISVARAIALGLDPDDIRSIENCLFVCHQCHVELDRNS